MTFAEVRHQFSSKTSKWAHTHACHLNVSRDQGIVFDVLFFGLFLFRLNPILIASPVKSTYDVSIFPLFCMAFECNL